VSAACNYLLENFDTEFMAEGSDKSTFGFTVRRKTEVIFSDGESSLGDSSLNQAWVQCLLVWSQKKCLHLFPTVVEMWTL